MLKSISVFIVFISFFSSMLAFAEEAEQPNLGTGIQVKDCRFTIAGCPSQQNSGDSTQTSPRRESPSRSAEKQAIDQEGEFWGSSCKSDAEDGATICKFDSNPAIRQAGAMFSQVASMKMADKDAVCGKWGAVLPKVDLAIAGYKTACTAMFARCTESCTQAVESVKAAINLGSATIDDLEKVKKYQRECNKYGQNLADVQQNVASYFNTENTKSVVCAEAKDPWAEFCKNNPTVYSCQQRDTASTDCDSASGIQNNRVCFCRKYPAQCAEKTTSFASGINGNSGGGTGADGKPLPGDFGGLGGDGGTGGLGLEVPQHPGKDGAGGSLARGAAGGAGGGGMGAGGGQGKGGGGAAGGPAGSAYNTKIIGGYGVGGGGGAGGGGSYGSRDSDPRGGAGGGLNFGRGGAGRGDVDLRQFMPGGKMDPSRSLAGVAGPDGITGPNTDIWKKIRSRYFSVSPSLRP